MAGVNCPCCKQPVDPKEHPGLVINRSAYLRSQLISMEAVFERNTHRVPKSMKQQLEWAAQQINLGEAIIAFKNELKKLVEIQA
jgi:hypothetical protein